MPPFHSSSCVCVNVLPLLTRTPVTGFRTHPKSKTLSSGEPHKLHLQRAHASKEPGQLCTVIKTTWRACSLREKNVTVKIPANSNLKLFCAFSVENILLYHQDILSLKESKIHVKGWMKIFYDINVFPKDRLSPGAPVMLNALSNNPGQLWLRYRCRTTDPSANPVDSFKVYTKCNQFSPPAA